MERMISSTSITAFLIFSVISMIVTTEGYSENSMQQHPFLFINQANIDRIRKAAQSPDYVQYVEDLKKNVERQQVEDLPELETEWWDEIKDKSWRETYQPINFHTGTVPRKWSGLALNCARAALLFPTSEYAEKGKQVLLGLSEFTFEYEHFDVGLNYATLANQCFQAYDILFDSFEEDERKRMDAFFKRMLDAVIKNGEYWVEHEPGGPLNNHYAWHKLAMALYGLFYDEQELVQEALFGPKGMIESLQYGFKDEGLWLESSISYQFVQTKPMLILAEVLENTGSHHAFWNYQTGDGRTLRQAFEALIEIAFPDQTLPNVGDCYGGRTRISRHPDYETLYARFRNPLYAWLLKQHPSRHPQGLWEGAVETEQTEPPFLASQLWPEHGYLMLRENEGESYWAGDGWTLFGTYAYSSVHHHKDKLSIMLFGNQHHWLVDCEAKSSSHHAFSSDVQKQLNRTSVCQNLMMVDNEDQNSSPETLDLIEFHNLSNVKRATIGDLSGILYDGVRQLRTLIILDDYVLDMYQVASDEEHQYSWMVHVNGDEASSSIEKYEWRPHDFPESPSLKWLQNPMKACEQREFSAEYSNQDKRFRIDLTTSGPAEVIRYGFPKKDTESPEVWPSLSVSRTTDTFWIIAVYRMDEAIDSELVISVSPGKLNQWEIRTKIDSEERTHIVPKL